MNDIDCVENADSSTHNKELAVAVLIDSPPVAGAEGFVENIVARKLEWRYLTKRYDRLGLTPCFRCSKNQLRLLLSRAAGGKKQSSKGIVRHYPILGLVCFVFRYCLLTTHDFVSTMYSSFHSANQ